MAKSKKRTMNISLTPELADYVERKVASGLYSSNSEFVREALRQYNATDIEFMPGEVERIRAKLAEAEDDIKAGRVGEWDPAQTYERVLERMMRQGKTIKP